MKKLLVVLIVFVVLVVAAVAVIEIGGRPFLQSYISAQIVKKLPGSDPDVTVGPGSLTLQALSGHLDSVDVSIPDANLGTLRSDVEFDAKNVPLDSTNAIGDVTIHVDADRATVQQLVRRQKGFEKATLRIDHDVSIGSKLTVFGATIPFAIGVTPKADGADLLLTPTSVTVNKSKIALADLRKLPFGANLLQLVKPQRLCVAQYLPKVITLESVKVAGDHLQLIADGTGIALATTDFDAVGSCS